MHAPSLKYTSMSVPLLVPYADKLRMPKPLSCWSVTVFFHPDDDADGAASDSADDGIAKLGDDAGGSDLLVPPNTASEPSCGIELGACHPKCATPWLLLGADDDGVDMADVYRERKSEEELDVEEGANGGERTADAQTVQTRADT